MFNRNWTHILGASILVAGLVACEDDATSPQSNDLVAVAAANASFSTLTTALIEAELVETLQGPGPFTVFAPTNAAFDALPNGVLDGLLADTDALVAVLTYHVVPGRLTAAELATRTQVETVNGATLPVVVQGDQIFVDGVLVATPDVGADNGVIHIVGEVLLPPSDDIVQVASDAEIFETLITALGVAELVETLQGPGPFTVFAPTDAAFAEIPAEDLNALLADPDALAEVLLYHVVAGELYSGDVAGRQAIETVNGASITVTVTGEGVFVDDALVSTLNVRASNGVIHIIDGVLFP